MNQQMMLQSQSSADTERIAEDIGMNLRGGEVVELISDLGGGKTTFTRGLVKGAGSEDHVSSPTFTVSKVYKTGKFEIHHFDFYRINDAGLLAHELSDLIGDPSVVTVIEWGKVVHHVLPESRLCIEIMQTDEQARELHLTYPGKLNYLFGK